jgi:hypothetical protein
LPQGPTAALTSTIVVARAATVGTARLVFLVAFGTRIGRRASTAPLAEGLLHRVPLSFVKAAVSISVELCHCPLARFGIVVSLAALAVLLRRLSHRR